MPYSEQEVAVLKKYRIMNQDGSFREIKLLQPNQPGGKPAVPGPIMALDVINRLLAADTTPEKAWIDWIFFQAGGGEKAKEASVSALQQIRDRFIDERTNGWTHPENQKFQAPVPRPQAEARWVKAEPEFRAILAVCDQDTVKRLRPTPFGYFRDWPGNANVYSNVVEAITRYLKLYKKLLRMNKETVRNSALAPLPTTPKEIPTWEQMNVVTKKVDRYFASKKARTDIRIADNKPIYSDDNITAICPLTYAAAVQWGHDEWEFANPAGFEQVLGNDDSGRSDQWKQRTQGGKILVYLTFTAPVPGWIIMRGRTPKRVDLTDLALHLDKDDMRENPDSWQVIDQENNSRQMKTIAQIKQMITAEATRVEPPGEPGMMTLGKRAYKNADEAQKVVASLDQALRAIKKWLATFDVKQVKSNMLTLEDAKVAD